MFSGTASLDCLQLQYIHRAQLIYPTPGDTIQTKLVYIFPLHFYSLSFPLKPKEHDILSRKGQKMINHGF